MDALAVEESKKGFSVDIDEASQGEGADVLTRVGDLSVAGDHHGGPHLAECAVKGWLESCCMLAAAGCPRTLSVFY